MKSQEKEKICAKIIELLANNGGKMKSADLREAIGNPPLSTFKGYKDFLAERGYLLKTTRNYLELDTDTAHPLIEQFTKDTLPEWQILFQLSSSKLPLTQEQIYDGCGGLMTSSKCYRILKKLREDKKFLEHLHFTHPDAKGQYCNRLLPAAPAILIVSEEKLDEFCAEFSCFEKSDPVHQSLLPFFTRASALLNGGYELENDFYHVHGRLGNLSARDQEMMKKLQKYPYARRQLLISHYVSEDELCTCKFSTAYIIYSMDKNCFYLLGESQGSPAIIRMDRIKELKEAQESNHCFHSPVYYKIYSEMFSISVDPPVHVRVRFEGVYNIQQKLSSLASARPAARVAFTDSGDLIYTDTVRGLPDFAHYIRSFGSSAIAEEPAELKELLLDSSRKVIENYEKQFHFGSV